MDGRAKKLVKTFSLKPHPEGGFYKEVFRSERKVLLGKQERNAITDIYFLLVKGTHSRFHAIRFDELWHFYEGAACELIEIDPRTLRLSKVLLSSRQRKYKHVVRAGVWQAAFTKGDYSLLGCTVAPGFKFSDLSFLRDNENMLKKIVAKHSSLSFLI